jgi:hypothetical protein
MNYSSAIDNVYGTVGVIINSDPDRNTVEFTHDDSENCFKMLLTRHVNNDGVLDLDDELYEHKIDNSAKMAQFLRQAADMLEGKLLFETND